jgi:signal transduction histidine kinase
VGTLARLVFPFRRLAVWLGVLVAIVGVLVVGIATLLVVPSLKDSLVNDRLRQVAASGSESLLPRDHPRFQFGDPASVVAYESSSGYQVAVLEAIGPDRFLQQGGSLSGGPGDPVARATLRTRRNQRAIVDTDARYYAEYGVYATDGNGQTYVLLFGAPLTDIAHTVATVKRRLLVAVAIALPLAWLVGAVAALALASRIRRLERAAARIAAGEFDRPVIDGGRDEVAELAGAFDDMRVRLERTDRARRDFIASASHELRTPIFALGGFLELLEDESDPAAQRDYIATMRDQVRRLTRLATDLLDLSRLDAGAQLARDDVGLAGIAETAASDFAAAAERRGATISVAADDVVALGDETRIGQICRVLVDNALRHNPPGVHVYVACATRGGRAILRVADDGPEIPDDARERLFDRFYRGQGSSEGSGLGLAIARELAARMGGSLELVEAPEGKAFDVSLPLAPADGAPLLAAPPAPARTG